MAQGLSNSAQTFQRFIDYVTRGLPNTFTYIDDILIASRTPVEHKRHLRELLKILDDYALCINYEKCVFGHPKLDFLGY